MRAASSPGLAAAASANGKLAPHRHVAGKMAHRTRMKSSWKLNHGLHASSGFIGQYGSDALIVAAAKATHSTSSNWQMPSARRGRAYVRARNDPKLLPAPR